MIKHIEFTSDCKRIAKDIMKQADDIYGDAIAYGVVTVEVSLSLVRAFNHDRYAHVNEWEKEINKNLKGCKVTYNDLHKRGLWVITFNIEYDDVDAETEDW